jgi:hypothetical protein
MDTRKLRRRIRYLLSFFVVGLVISGLTAFPLVWEITILYRLMGPNTAVEHWWPAMSQWISTVHQGMIDANASYPFLFYGTDWLAFAHIVIAIAFWGPLRDPVKNLWVIEFGMIACALVIPLALICGPLRGIPAFWRMIDCSFGVVGFFPLWLARKYVRRLTVLEHHPTHEAGH